MKAIKVAYVKGLHPSGFGYRRIGEVIGVRILEAMREERGCFHVRYDDGEEDFVAMESVSNGDYIFVHKDGTKLT